jgi:hypothetical protein
VLNKVGTHTRDGFIINLRERFNLQVQNSDDSRLILGVKIINRLHNKVVFEKKVTQFGIISVKN